MFRAVLDSLRKHRLIPVIALDDATDAGPLADALATGGLAVAEVTFRTDAAEAAIREMARRPGMLVGAGTVLNVDTVKRAVDAGAKFVVSPGFSEKIVSYCVEQNIAVIPGCVTATEIQIALEFGLNTVKFFPSETSGGIKAIKALGTPFGHVRFMPTGGITLTNLPDYLSVSTVLACGGSWMMTRELLAARAFDEISSITSASVRIAREHP